MGCCRILPAPKNGIFVLISKQLFCHFLVDSIRTLESSGGMIKSSPT